MPRQIMAKKAEKIRNSNLNYCHHLSLHTDTHILTSYIAIEEKTYRQTWFLNQSYLIWSHSLKQSLNKKLHFCAVLSEAYQNGRQKY